MLKRIPYRFKRLRSEMRVEHTVGRLFACSIGISSTRDDGLFLSIRRQVEVSPDRSLKAQQDGGDSRVLPLSAHS
jgi:hypothetical protein